MSQGVRRPKWDIFLRAGRALTAGCAVQVEASGKVKELFPNLADAPAVDLTTGGDGGAHDDPGSEDKRFHHPTALTRTRPKSLGLASCS